jgi:uncharacterized protein (DUF111 family)
LLRGLPVYAGDIEGEFVTPTGAAIVRTLCESFGPMTAMKIDRVGYGAGSRDPEGFPNTLRLVLGESGESREAPGIQRTQGTEGTKATEGTHEAVQGTDGALRSDERIVVIETNIDDMNPQAYGFVMERAFALGALDVFLAPVQMKKDRPGVLLTVLAKTHDFDALIDLLLRETTTLGVRYYNANRRTLDRVVDSIATEYGVVRIKVARDGGRTLHFQPEYEDCKRIAEQVGVTLLEVQDAARAAYREGLKSQSGEADSNGELQKK